MGGKFHRGTSLQGHYSVTQRQRIGAVERLRELPEVFDLRDVEIVCGVNREAAHIYCHRWASRKLVKPLGPRVGVYFNLIRDTNAVQKRLKEALDKAFRIPMIAIGASSLFQHGWTSQHPHTVELAVPVTARARSYPKVDGALLIPRNRAWFTAIGSHFSEGTDGFLTLDPAYALVDALTTPLRSGFKDDVWKPEQDDLYSPEDLDMSLEEFREAVLEAADALGANKELIEDYLPRVGDKFGNGQR